MEGGFPDSRSCREGQWESISNTYIHKIMVLASEPVEKMSGGGGSIFFTLTRKKQLMYISFSFHFAFEKKWGGGVLKSSPSLTG